MPLKRAWNFKLWDGDVQEQLTIAVGNSATKEAQLITQYKILQSMGASCAPDFPISTLDKNSTLYKPPVILDLPTIKKDLENLIIANKNQKQVVLWIVDANFPRNLTLDLVKELATKYRIKNITTLGYTGESERFYDMAEAWINGVTDSEILPPIFEKDTPDSIVRNYIETKTELLKNFATDSELSSVYRYNNKHWEIIERGHFEHHIDTSALSKIMSEGYNNGKLRAISEMCLRGLPVKPEPKTGYISFKNGTVHISKNGEVNLIPHDPIHGLMSSANYKYNKKDNKHPNFDMWLTRATMAESEKESGEKALTVLAALYMVATNRYDWQMFIEVIGQGGTGKSIFAYLCQLIAGGNNCTCTIDLDALEGKKGKGGLINIVGKPLILCPDQPSTVGELDMVKRITGGDPVSIPRMHKSDLNLPFVPAVIVITANQAITVTDRSTGIHRRRIIITFDNRIPKDEQDESLKEKLEQETSAIFNTVCGMFESPTDAKNVLAKALDNKDKLDSMVKTEPLTAWIVDCLLPDPDFSERIGSSAGFKEARRQPNTNRLQAMIAEATSSLYGSYLVYCEYNGIENTLSQVKFPTALEGKLLQLPQQGFDIVERQKPKNVSMIKGIRINKNSLFLQTLSQTKNNYCSYNEIK